MKTCPTCTTQFRTAPLTQVMKEDGIHYVCQFCKTDFYAIDESRDVLLIKFMGEISKSLEGIRIELVNICAILSDRE